ncbi:trypsin-like peptidase domain-containing protein [Photobacterium galatheae]|uniref:Serine protease n=1 Tax=Photobacterium galatheae TaxID=1654360 RepID=A0A066RYF8_9GAMM|nr:trypsin-like peptidase domain-containing protein [Photobacterium galatheae]KDM92433.1 hypothetical protein EA58_05685 [Photobacterium galatheae]MCM0147913.1 serine protease [Photobacterium galatheae]
MNRNGQYCHLLLKQWAEKLFTGLLALGLVSCIMTNGDVSQAPAHAANQQVVIGVPILLGGFGSAVPITPHLQVTAKHVARYSWNRDVIYHPLCDLALIRTDSTTVPTWGLIYPDQPVTHLGHSLLGNSIQGQGKYLQDVMDTNSQCLYSLSDAPVMSGMSGGPVLNDAGEIVGITVAIVNNPEDLRNLRPALRYSQFIPATLIFDWLAELGITPTSASHDLASIEVSPYVRRLNRNTEVPDSLNAPHDPETAAIRPASPPVSESRPTPSPLSSFQTQVTGTFPATTNDSKDVALKADSPAIYQTNDADAGKSSPETIQNAGEEAAFQE